MASSSASKNDTPGDVSDIKRKLAWRMGVAGMMIVALLGGLALFDRYSAPGSSGTTEQVVPRFDAPVPVAKRMDVQPVMPPEPEPNANEDVPAEPELSAPPVGAAPLPDEPPPPIVAARPSLPRSLAPAAPATPRASAPPSPATAVPTVIPRTSPRVEEPVARSQAAAPSSAPATPPEPAVPSSPPAPSSPPRLSSGYAVQAGVFSDPRRAEDLQTKLIQAGIPATIEARVQVGPFASRKEADAVRAKLKALGIESVMVPPRSARP